MGSLVRIVIDTREQMPYTFDPKRFSVERRALPAGDYSLDGSEERVAVERKSLADFAQTVIRARRRFHEELRKLAACEFACIVVEGSMRDVLDGAYGTGRIPTLSSARPSRSAWIGVCPFTSAATGRQRGNLSRHTSNAARGPSTNIMSEGSPSSAACGPRASAGG